MVIKLNLKELAEEFIDNYPILLDNLDSEDLDSFLEEETYIYLEDNETLSEMERNAITIDIQPFLKLEIYNRVKEFDSEERETLKNEIVEYETVIENDASN